MKTLRTLLIGLALMSAFVVTQTAEQEDAPPAPAAETPVASYDGFSADQIDQMKSKEEKHEFQAEVGRLMDIIINSLYSHREVFLRELISNASDAIDKIRFLSVTDKDALGTTTNMDIRIKLDKEAKTLSIRDTGVGMTKEELIKHLGVVASSGTTKFIEASKQGTDTLSLIGQFGVGFYSVYLVANHVTVISKSNDDPKQHVWQSSAQHTFTVTEDPRGNTLGRGTEVLLHLKEDATEFLDQATLEKIVVKYSSFINHPIFIEATKSVEKEVPDDSEEEKKDDADATKEDGDVEVKDTEKKAKTKKITVEEKEWKQLNENKAIWTRKPKDVSEKEYEEFYKSLTKDYSAPLHHLHFSAEGEIAFKSILYIPKQAPSDLYDKYYGKSNAMKLYVRRVLISEEFDDFLPRYLSFIKGVVDSDDLPLNVSRETLSKSRVLKVMAKKITRKALDMLKKLADDAEKAEKRQNKKGDEEKKDDEEKKEEEDEETKKKAAEADKEKIQKWNDFWKQYSKSVKLGMIEDASNKSKLAKLLRFISSKSEGKLISLQTYVDGMKEKQDQIYFITGESVAKVKDSPFLEALNKRGLEVLFLVDPLDEYLISNMPEFDGKKLVSVTKEGLKFGDESEQEKKVEASMNKFYGKLIKFLKETYGDKVEKVMVSNRVTETPCVLVTGQYGWSANMERIMKAQTFADMDKQQYMLSKKTMEINPRHPLIKEMAARVEAGEEGKVKDSALLMFDAALLSSGFSVDHSAEFGERLRRVLSQGMNVDPNAKMLGDEDFPVEEEPAAEKSEEVDLDEKKGEEKEEL